MLVKTTQHEMWEVWSEDAAESAFVQGKPTRKDVDELWKKEWPGTKIRPKVYKLTPFYVQNTCDWCHGSGRLTDRHNEDVGQCTKCHGKGYYE